MSDAAREAALAHFGVKGMRWGVRKSRKTASRQIESVLARSPDRFDPKYSTERVKDLQRTIKQRFGDEKVSLIFTRETEMKDGRLYIDNMMRSERGQMDMLRLTPPGQRD